MQKDCHHVRSTGGSSNYRNFEEVMKVKYGHRMFFVQAYQTSLYVVLPGGIFLGKRRSSYEGNSDGKMNVQSACPLNTWYFQISVTTVM
jgi:hypothetical protein